jgi:hypothetical protein
MDKMINVNKAAASAITAETPDVLNLEQMSHIIGGTEYEWVYIDGQWVLVACGDTGG